MYLTVQFSIQKTSYHLFYRVTPQKQAVEPLFGFRHETQSRIPGEREGTLCNRELSGRLLILSLPELKCHILAGRHVLIALLRGGTAFYMPVEMTTNLK